MCSTSDIVLDGFVLLEACRVEDISYDLMKEAKLKGYADRQIAHLVRCLESEVFDRRVELGIERSYRLVDTCAAEFVAQTPYYYSTFCVLVIPRVVPSILWMWPVH